jgi:hypothetical protein
MGRRYLFGVIRLYSRQNAPTATSLLTNLPWEFDTKRFGYYSNPTQPVKPPSYLHSLCTPPYATSLQGHLILQVPPKCFIQAPGVRG